MTRKEFLLAVDEMLDLPPATLHGPERLEDFHLWDSMGMVTFMALADSNNGTTLAPRELGSCETVDDLLRIAKVEI